MKNNIERGIKMNYSPLVYIILVNYNGCSDTVECIKSINEITYSNYKIVVVDNSSSDNSEEIIKKIFPHITFMQTGKNLGFGGGNNVGIKYALNNAADYVLLLNNDTSVKEDFLEHLVSTAEKDKKVGVVGGKIFYYDLPTILWYAGGKINTFTGKTQHVGDLQVDKLEYNKLCETGYITGCMMLLSSDIIKKVGMMDERYFLYYEESDWNVRIKKAGYKIIYNPKSVIYHKVSASTKKQSDIMTYYYDRNVYYFIMKNFGIMNKIFMFFYIRIILVLKYIKHRNNPIRTNIILKTYKSIKKQTMGEYVK